MRSHSMSTSVLALALAVPLLAGCGAASGSQSVPVAGHHHSGSHVMPDGKTMKDSDMQGMDMKGMDMGADSAKPSAAAAMICSEETAGAVQRGLALGARPQGLSSFSDQLFRCTYQLPSGELRLSVKDLTSEAPGRAYYEKLEADLAPVQPIRGVASFGFPAFQTAHGDVVFIKDHKTLWVDASRLADSDLPKGSTRTGTAYGVAAAVIACWTE